MGIDLTPLVYMFWICVVLALSVGVVIGKFLF